MVASAMGYVALYPADRRFSCLAAIAKGRIVASGQEYTVKDTYPHLRGYKYNSVL